MDKSLKVVTWLLKISTAPQDYECLCLYNLFAIIFDVLGMRVLLYTEATGGIKERYKEKC